MKRFLVVLTVAAILVYGAASALASQDRGLEPTVNSFRISK
jgi:hypothetical protein